VVIRSTRSELDQAPRTEARPECVRHSTRLAGRLARPTLLPPYAWHQVTSSAVYGARSDIITTGWRRRSCLLHAVGSPLASMSFGTLEPGSAGRSRGRDLSARSSVISVETVEVSPGCWFVA
jgi:hypothetical protein